MDSLYSRDLSGRAWGRFSGDRLADRTAPLPLPLLPRSERKIPPWVLSSMIIARIQVLLRVLERRFEMKDEIRAAPRGRIDWPSYARREMSRSRFLKVPCGFPNLQDDRELKAAIRFTLEKQLGSLLTETNGGSVYLQAYRAMSGLARFGEGSWLRTNRRRHRDMRRLLSRLTADSFARESKRSNGLHKIAVWRGSAIWKGFLGRCRWTSFLRRGRKLSWPVVARKIGGVLRTGRQRQTVTH